MVLDSSPQPHLRVDVAQRLADQPFAGDICLGDKVAGAALALDVAQPDLLHMAHQLARLPRHVDDNFHITLIQMHFSSHFPDLC
jgi:hypothetical protein